MNNNVVHQLVTSNKSLNAKARQIIKESDHPGSRDFSYWGKVGLGID